VNSRNHLIYSKFANPVAIRRLWNAIEEGIYSYWRNAISFTKMIPHLRVLILHTDQPLAISLQSDVQLVFVTWAILMGVSLTVCIFETIVC
jgi:hypothetical protein